MGERLRDWLCEDLEYERRNADGSAWGCDYNRLTLLVFGLGGAALLLLALTLLARLVG